jgi:hypothetical protein
MQQNELVLRTFEVVTFGTFQGLPVEQCEYKEIMDYLKELWDYIMELAARAMEALAELLRQAVQEGYFG